MILFKVCKKCNSEKPIDQFYPHKMMGDGFLNFCKECVKARVAEHRIKNIEKIRQYDRDRAKEPDRKLSSQLISTRWRKSDKRIQAAHNKLKRAINKGLIQRMPCIVCGNERSEAHHESYNRPLDVIWYCSEHHKARHKEMKKLGIDPLEKANP